VSLIAGDQSRSTIEIHGEQPKDDMNPWFDAVGSGYFRTMGIPLLMGREFTARDRMGAPRVAIVNDVFARYYFGNESPIGRRFGTRKDGPMGIEIVGVVRGSKYSRVDEKIPKVVFLAYAQDANPSSLMLYARAAGDPKALFATLRREANALDGALPVTALRTMDDQVDESLSTQRMMAGLSVCFSIVATLLAAIGLYGVMAYTVSRRTREIGIRVALGASSSGIVRLVLRQGLGLTLGGIVLGVLGALALARVTRSLLFGVSPTDPTTYVLVAGVILGIALLACLIPAQRAMRVDPLVAIRDE
jgi:predicted permease